MDKEYKIYTIKSGDSLALIAKQFYGNSTFSQKIAEYNNIKNPNSIFINQQIELPGIEEYNEIITPKKIQTTTKILVKVPNGYNEVLSTFGNINRYIKSNGQLSPSWSILYLTTIELPFPIKLAWNLSQKVTKLTCHKLLNQTFINTFTDIQNAGLQSEIKSFGGTFNFRSKRSSNRFSTHSWGIAIDLNPLSNAMGTKGDMHPGIVEIFRSNGFKWGGDWSGKGCDPMHFQYCTGY